MERPRYGSLHNMKAILRKGKSFSGSNRLNSLRINHNQQVALETVGDYIYLLEAHGDKFELQPPALFRRISRHGRSRAVQSWELRAYLREGWRIADHRPAPSAQRILVIRNMGLGDVLMVTPTLRALIAAGKEVEFATLARYVPLLYGFEGLQACHALGTDYLAERFDAWLDLNWVAEKSKLAVNYPRQEIFARAAGMKLDSPVPEYKVAQQERAWARHIIGGRPTVAIQMSASCPLRTYPLPHLRVVADTLIRSGLALLTLGDRREMGLPGAKNLTAALSIRATGALIEQCAALIAPDSGLLHLAAAVGTPSVGIFGPIDPRLRVAGYPLCKTVSGNNAVGCKPCNDRAHCLRRDRKLVEPHPECLRAIEPEAIAELALQQCQGGGVAPRGSYNSGLLPVSRRGAPRAPKSGTRRRSTGACHAPLQRHFCLSRRGSNPQFPGISQVCSPYTTGPPSQ